MSNNVIVVIPNWNGQEHIGACLESLKAVKAKVVVVDNGSTDQSKQIIKKFAGVQLIELPENRGFAGGVNAGIKKALDQDFVALLNNDAVVESNWLENLLKTAQKHPKVGIVTSKLMRS